MHISRNYISAAALLSASLLCAPNAFAVDGVIEINQSCAITSGCFAGDSAGFPVTINTSAPAHSFRLTSDLILQNANLDGIIIGINGVSIDLNSFAILTQTCATAAPTTSCEPTSGNGVGVNALGTFGASIKNGYIAGMGTGVSSGDESEVINLRVRSNRTVGIAIGVSSIASKNVASDNGTTGISALAQSIITG